MLQELAATRSGTRTRDTSATRRRRPLYVVAEKILSGRERLPAGWAVHGTTGYNFLNELNGLFVDSAQARRMRRSYAKLTGQTRVVRRRALRQQAADHGNRDGKRAERARAHARSDRREQPRVARLHARQPARRASPKSSRAFRSIAPTWTSEGWTPEDRAVVEQAIARARRRNPAMESSLFDFLPEVVLPRDRRRTGTNASAGERRERLSARERRGSARAAAFRDEAAAIHRPGAGEGARGHRVLSLQRAAVAQRGRRRSVERFGRSRRRVPRGQLRARRGLAVRDARDGDARHQARRGRARAHQRALGDARRVGARGRRDGCGSTGRTRTIVDGEPAPDRNDEYRFYQALARRAGRSTGGRRRGCRPRRRSGRAPAGLHDQGGQGGEGAYQLDHARTSRTRMRVERVRRARADRQRRRDGSSPRSCRFSGGSRAARR